MKKSVTRRDLFEKGMIKTGQYCQIVNRPETAALIVSEKTVQYMGEIISFNVWLKRATGWAGVSLFKECEIIGEGTLENIRRKYLGLPPVFINYHKKRQQLDE